MPWSSSPKPNTTAAATATSRIERDRGVGVAFALQIDLQERLVTPWRDPANVRVAPNSKAIGRTPAAPRPIQGERWKAHTPPHGGRRRAPRVAATTS